MLNFDRLARYLLPLSLLYLTLPHIIFFAGWLKWYLALACILLVSLIPLYSLLERDWIAGKTGGHPNLPALHPNHIALVLVMALLLLGLSGIGGYGYQDSDWYKHNAKLYQIPSLSAAEIPHGFSLSFAPDTQAKLIGAALILVFCFLEFGLYGILIYRNRGGWNAKTKALFLSTMLCLALLPSYVYGGANDLTMRASIPALFMLALFLSRSPHSESLSFPTRLILILLIVLGSGTAWIELRRHLTEIQGAGKLLNLQEASQVLSLWDYPVEGPDSLIRQYIGSSEAPFFRFLTR